MPCRATPSRPGASETPDERRCSADRAELSRLRHTESRSRHTCARPRPISSSTRVEGGTPPSIGWGCALDRSRGEGSGTVTELAQPPRRFREIARLKLADSHTQEALDSSTARLYGNRSAAWQALPEVQELRQRAHDARMRVIDDLDAHVARFAEALEARGGGCTSRERPTTRRHTSLTSAAAAAPGWPSSRSRWRRRRSTSPTRSRRRGSRPSRPISASTSCRSRASDRPT